MSTSVFSTQYEWVRGSRAVLFDYCSTLKPEHLLVEVQGFGRGGSIRYLLVHIANTYQYWIAKHALQQNIDFTDMAAMVTMDDINLLFTSVDQLIAEFLEQFEEGKFHHEMISNILGRVNHASPFKVFTHVITHEYHHKGQILSISRHLGYIPVDTDIIR